MIDIIKTALVRIALILLTITMVGCANDRKANLYYSQRESLPAKQDTLGKLELFHYWREIPDNQYLFEAPTPEQISDWKRICEQENPCLPQPWSEVYTWRRSINHIVTIDDIIQTYWIDDVREDHNSFLLWRLEQFDTTKHIVTTEYERFKVLQERIDSLCDYDPVYQSELNWRDCLADRCQNLLVSLIAYGAIAIANPELSRALADENDAWKSYHAQFDSTFNRAVGPNPQHDYSSWSMAYSQGLYDDDITREASLNDFYFMLADKSLPYEIERHIAVSNDLVVRKYKDFMNTLKDDEYYYPIPDRRKALEEEMFAWNTWMKSRDAVSSLLSGELKDIYDNATNNARRRKYISLHNKYEGYGIIGNDILSCLIPYSIPDDELLTAPSFEESWQLLLDEIDSRR